MAMVMSTVHLKGISHDKVVLEYLKSNKAEALEIYFDAPGNNLLRENHEKCFHITPLYSAFKDVTEEIIWKRKAWVLIFHHLHIGLIPCRIQGCNGRNYLETQGMG